MGKMSDFKKFIKSSGIYFVGTVMTKIISFFMLPLYTSYISPEDYGTFDLYNAYIMFLCSVLFLDIWSGIMRFMFDYKKEDRNKPISSGFAIFLISCVLYTVILIGINAFLDLQYPLWLFLYGILMNVQTLVGYIARGYGKNILYASSGLVGSVVTILANILLLVYFKMDFSALFISSCIGFLANILVIIIGLRKYKILSIRYFDKKLFKQLLLFSLPLCLNSVAYWFLTSYNRVVIVNELGAASNGYYAIASRFGSFITLFTTCFQMAWQELAYAKSANENNLSDFYTSAINNYIKFMGAGLILIIPAIFLIYPIMINSSYDAGKELVPFYLFGTILSSVSSFLGNAFSAEKENKLLFITMLLGGIANVVCIHLFISKIGLQASNVALAVGFLFCCIARVVLFNRTVKIKIDYKNILVLLLAFCIVSFVYLNCNYVLNIIVLIITVVLVLFLFRDFIRVILKKNNESLK